MDGHVCSSFYSRLLRVYDHFGKVNALITNIEGFQSHCWYKSYKPDPFAHGRWWAFLLAGYWQHVWLYTQLSFPVLHCTSACVPSMENKWIHCAWLTDYLSLVQSYLSSYMSSHLRPTAWCVASILPVWSRGFVLDQVLDVICHPLSIYSLSI